jgi:hypothetical protein
LSFFLSFLLFFAMSLTSPPDPMVNEMLTTRSTYH